MKRVNCEQIQALLVDYIEFEIFKDQRNNVTKHLVSCGKCRSEHEELISLMGNIKNQVTLNTDQAFFDALPDKVLKEVSMKRLLSADSSNVISFAKHSDVNQSKKEKAPLVDAQIGEQSRSGLPTGLPAWFSKRAVAVAASLAIIVSTVLLMENQSPSVLDSVKFQATIKTNQNLANMVDQFVPIGATSVNFGFADQKQAGNSFYIGSLYAETMAYVRGGNLKASARHLESLYKALSKKSPEILSIDRSHQVHTIQIKVAKTLSSGDNSIKEILTDLQLSYDRHRIGLSKSKSIFFQAGAWSVDVALAALANDRQLLKSADMLTHLLNEMPGLYVPKGVIVTLTEMRNISAKSEITNRDMKNFYRLTQKLRGLLS